MSNHAIRSPSSAHRWMNCPGSVKAEEGLPDSSSEFAAEGTAAHDLAERVLVAPEDITAYDYIGEIIEVDETERGGPVYQFVVDDDMAEFVQRYVVYVSNIPGEHIDVEVRVPIDFMTGEDDAAGTADAVIVADGTMHVVDLKYGRGVRVDAADNDQLYMYAAGALERYSLLFDIEDVVVHIAQPRLAHWDMHVLTLEELDAFVMRVQAASRATYKPNAKRVPGEKQCRWCKAKATCPALVEFTEQVVQDPADLDEPADLAKALALVDLVENWAKAVKAKGTEVAEAGTHIPGWKLVEGRKGNKRWTSQEAAEARLRGLRLKVSDILPQRLVSPSQALKLVGRSKADRLEDLIEIPDGKPTLVPESDKRPAINNAEAMGFDTFDN